jgi:hypothetical protein
MRGPTRLLLCVGTVVGFAIAASPCYASGQPGIIINGNAGFATCGCATGSGTPSNPYVIGPFAITSPNGQGSAITIENTTADFTITGISANYTNTDPADAVIHLSGVSGPATVNNVSANNDGIGIEIDSSSNVALTSISVNKMNGAGLVIKNSTNVSTANSKYKATSDEVPFHDADGLYAVNSSDLQIGGMPKCPQGVCNTFDYDSGWGVYLQNTNNVTIDQASANADDTGGYILDGASNVTIENSTAEAGGPICISLNGSKEPSGYFNTGLMGNLMLIDGAHNNTIENDTFNGYAPGNGYDIAGTPNPFYFNVCTGADSTTFVPSGTAMGTANTFSNLCYKTSNDVAGLPPSTCKS